MHFPDRRTPRRSIFALALALGLVMTGAASAEFPTKRADPGIVGVAQEGQTLNGRTGQWLYDNGLKCEPGDCTYRYTWQRCHADGSGCVDIPGATGYTYLLGAADVGKRIRFVEWVAKRDCGATNSQTGQTECRDVSANGVSAQTLPVAPKPLTVAQATAPPTIAGLAMEDEVLRATGGTWTGPGTITKVIYWQRCNAVGEACATIAGATGASYKLASGDVGSRIRVIETATNEGGVAQAVSTPTAVVVELRPSAARPAINAARVGLPNRLLLDKVAVSQVGRRVTVRARVSDTRGFRITGVLVKLTPTGLLQGSAAERVTDAAGFATFTFTATGSGATFIYAEARRKGEKAQTGVSTARLFRVRIR